jgi:hypothetical protein
MSEESQTTSDLRKEDLWRSKSYGVIHLPRQKTETRVQRFALDGFGAVYAVSSPDATEEFELILGGAA